MPFDKKIALAGSHRELVAGASVARAIDNNEIVSATVVLRRRTEPAALGSYAFTDPRSVNRHTRE